MITLLFLLLMSSNLMGECIKCYEHQEHETAHGIIQSTVKKCMATRDLLYGAKTCPGCGHSALDHTVYEDQVAYQEIVDGHIVANPQENYVLNLETIEMKPGDTLEDAAKRVQDKIKHTVQGTLSSSTVSLQKVKQCS